MPNLMQANPAFEPPPVEPLLEKGHRPLWSVMIPTYNCAKYLRQTLKSVLAQDPGPELMQIEVVDDYSTKDDPEAVVREIGNGRVTFFRKPKNEGAVSNFNTCIQRSRGHLVHILHGDDYVAGGFYAEISMLQNQQPELALYACRTFAIDEVGTIEWVTGRIPELTFGTKNASSFYYGTAIQCAGVVIKKDFYEKYGGFLTSLSHTADCEMWTRAISQCGGVVSDKVLSYYRMFSNNDTGRLMRTGENIRDLERLHDIFAGRFSDFDQIRAMRRSADLALSQSGKFAAMGDQTASLANLAMHHEISRKIMQKSKIPLFKKLKNKAGKIKHILLE